MTNLNTYIDRCIIDEYATKNFYRGYTLDINDLPQHERDNFLDQLMANDTAVRDFVLHQMQKLIDERLGAVESSHRRNAGLMLMHLSNGDTQLTREEATW